MKNLTLLALIAVTLTSCSSEPSKQTSTPSTKSVAATHDESPRAQTAASEEPEASQVLTKPKKCPKKSKLVNGKCTLDVESND